MICQQVVVEHKKSIGLLQPFLVVEWKWDNVIMDFVQGLSHTYQGHDSIWVTIDRATKSANFILVKIGYLLNALSKLYIRDIVRYMVYQIPLYHIGIQNLTYVYENVYKKLWV